MGRRGRASLFAPIEKWLKAMMRHRRYEHIFRGHANMNASPPRGTGFHHRFMGQNPTGARVRTDADGNEIIIETNVNGTYRARVDILGPDGNWYPKKAASTFFPDNWTPQEVDETIKAAFRNGSPIPDKSNAWTGWANGLTVDGFYNSTGSTWYSAWPSSADR